MDNPDVLDAVPHGIFPSGRAHFEQHGRRARGAPARAPRPGPAAARGHGHYLRLSESVRGWCRGEEAQELFCLAYLLEGDAVIVEIGSFLGSGSIILGGARKARGSGRVHCVDPFDCSGDGFSQPIYREIVKGGSGDLRAQFEANVRRAELQDWAVPHQGGAVEVASEWQQPIDLLFLDGDQSPRGARAAYAAWAPFLKPGGIIAVHNSNPRRYAPDHDGQYRLVMEEIVEPSYTGRYLRGSTHFARRAE